MNRRYKAFISYSWSDKDWGRWLHQSLEIYRTPSALVGRETAIGPVPASLHPIFRDREEEAAGHGIGAAIETAMAASEFLIVICSPRSAQSQWVNREVAWFKRHKDKTRILALVIEGEPGASFLPGREAEECFPRTLLYAVDENLQPTDVREDAPLAADARTEGDGKRGAKLKLAAAMLGVGLDDLVRRDERRRTLRRRWMMSGMAAGMAALSGLSLYAFNQRDAALVARNDAVTARDDAEEIIEHILTDLKADLEGFGTLKSVTAIGNRAIGYYEGQDVTSLTPDQLGRRARVLLMLGEADNKRGDLDAALARYKTAEATTSEQLARDPDNAQRIFDHAQSVFWVGYIAWQRGDRAKAKTQFTEYYRLAQQLVAIDPTNDDWQAELEYAYSNLGTLAMDEGEAAEAEAWFRKSLELSLTKLEKAPDDEDRVIVAGQSYAWLADALHRQLDFENAKLTRISEIQLYRPFLDQPKVNKTILGSATVAEFVIAQLEFRQGAVEAAAERAARSVGYANKLLAFDAGIDESKYLSHSSLAHVLLAETYLALGRATEASQAASQALIHANQLVGQDPTTAIWRGRELAQAKLISARVEVFSSNRVSAKSILDDLIDQQRPLAANVQDPAILKAFCAALAMRARIERNSNADWTEIIDVMAKSGERKTPEAQALLAEALFETGQLESAVTIAAEVYDKGYRHPEFMLLIARFPGVAK